MKLTNLMVLALCAGIASAHAQDPEQVLNSDPINVDGYLQDRPVTDGELEEIRGELKKQKMGTQLNKEKAKDLGKLTQQTEKLLESQDEYIDQKIESTQAIKQFNKKHEENQRKLRCIVEELNTKECEPYRKMSKREKEEVVQEIRVAQAAPAPVITAPAPEAPLSFGPFESIKLLPYAGSTTFNGDREQLEAELAMGLRIESNINSRFAVGIGLNLNQLKTEDFANSGNNSFRYGNYYGAYGTAGREIQYRDMGVDLYGKFFITGGERFRPYLGAGMGYSRATMNYLTNNPYSYGMYSFGDENYKASTINARVMGGSEIMITRSFGFNIEAAYATGIGDGFSKLDAKNPYSSPDQARLQELGKEIINSSALSIYAGAVVVF